MRGDGKSYVEIAVVLNVTRQITRHLCNYELSGNKKKRGPKEKIRNFDVYRIHREISNIKKYGKKVTTTKIIANCNLEILQSTC